MTNWVRFSVVVVLVGVLCGCSPSDTAKVASTTGEKSGTRSSESPAVNGNLASEAGNAKLAPSSGQTMPDSSSTEAPSNPPPEPPTASIPPEPRNPSESSEAPEKSDVPDTNLPKDVDRGDSAPPDPDPPASKASSKPAKSGPVVPSGKMGTALGDTIPEVEGKDVEGVRFQLSDYEGKVLMIDFWGDW